MVQTSRGAGGIPMKMLAIGDSRLVQYNLGLVSTEVLQKDRV